ncbi:MAG: hypothetical protein ACHREM_05070 [Polyangiales bacterium]
MPGPSTVTCARCGRDAAKGSHGVVQRVVGTCCRECGVPVSDARVCVVNGQRIAITCTLGHHVTTRSASSK